MSQSKRPINVGFSDLLQFRWPITALTSISHRIAGVVLFIAVGFLLFALEQSLASEASFNQLSELLTSPVGQLVTWLILASLAYHFVAGVKHLIMDGSDSESLEAGTRAAMITWVVSGILMVLAALWVI
ncbi:MAG: succinate dehydrogenase, cytochrome b556 subunit [Pseudomonadales bacterium]